MRENPVGTLLALNKLGRPEWAPRNYEGFAQEGYLENPYVFRAIQLRGAAIGGLRWMAVRKGAGKNAKREEVEDHPMLKLLKRPNPFQGQSQFFEAVESFLLIAGNSYIAQAGALSGANKGKPSELWTLRPDCMTVIPGTGPYAPVGGYEFKAKNAAAVKRFAVGEIMHMRRFHPLNDFYGMSPLEPGGRSADMNNAGRIHNVALLQNGASPSGAIFFKGRLTPDQRDQVQRQLADEHTGPGNAGSIFIGEGEGEWTQMGLSPKDMNWIEGQRMSARETVSVLGVPSELVGDSGNRTYSNYGEARHSFYEDTVVPEADFVRDELNNFLGPRYGDGVELEYDKDAIEALREGRGKLWSFVDASFLAGTITLNEARAEKGYDDEKGGDYYVLPMTVRPAGAPVAGGGDVDPATGHAPAPDPTKPKDDDAPSDDDESEEEAP